MANDTQDDEDLIGSIIDEGPAEVPRGQDCDWCSIYYDGPLYDEEPDQDSPWDEYDYYDFPEDNEDGLFDPMEKEDIPQ